MSNSVNLKQKDKQLQIEAGKLHETTSKQMVVAERVMHSTEALHRSNHLGTIARKLSELSKYINTKCNKLFSDTSQRDFYLEKNHMGGIHEVRTETYLRHSKVRAILKLLNDSLKCTKGHKHKDEAQQNGSLSEAASNLTICWRNFTHKLNEYVYVSMNYAAHKIQSAKKGPMSSKIIEQQQSEQRPML